MKSREPFASTQPDQHRGRAPLENDMTNLRNENVEGPVRDAEAGPTNSSKPGRPSLACRWQKASDGALVMAWSLVEARVPALRIVSSNPPRAQGATGDKLAAPSRRTNRIKSATERAAIVALLAAGGFL